MAYPQRMRLGGKPSLGFSHRNSFNALVEDYYLRHAEVPPSPPTPRQPIGSNPRLAVFAKNATSTTIEPGEILGIAGPIFDLTDAPNQVYSAPNVEGVTPDAADHAAHFVVALDFIEQDKVGPSVLIGAAFVKINWTDEGHTHCKVATGETMLQSAASGIKVFLVEPIPDAEYLPATLWGLVVLGGGGGGGSVEVNFAFGGVTSEVTAATDWDVFGAGMVRILDDDGDPGPEIEVTNRYFNIIPLRTPVWIYTVTVDGSPRHYVLGAGCGAGPTLPEPGS